jgi:predicted nucleotidyltransferase
VEAAPLPPVRLKPEEIAAVKRIVAEHFGPDAEVRVFGSRARLDRRGGDLDLHVRVPSEKPDWRVECRAADAIERALDDLHVDLLLLSAGEAPQRIDEVAIETGVLL